MQINKISVGVEPVGNLQKVTWNRIQIFDNIYKKLIFAAKQLFMKTIVVPKNVLIFCIRIPKTFFVNIKSRIQSFTARRKTLNSEAMENRGLRSKKPSMKKVALLVIIIIVISLVYLQAKGVLRLKGSNNAGSALGDKVEINAPQKSLEINKGFQFPLLDTKGKEISKLEYVLEKAELRDEIIVKGQKATAVKGRIFLVLYLKIKNSYTQKIEMNTRDYVRLSVNGNEEEWLAPDIHNDPVEIQAQSTKTTRLGFPINESDTRLRLRVGQISGDKEVIDLNF